MKTGAMVLLLLMIRWVEPESHFFRSPPEERVWVKYTDSAEAAFSVEVPLGWQVKGGMYRFGFFDARTMIDVRSLDGTVVVRLNDASLPTYVLPEVAGRVAADADRYQRVVAGYQQARSFAEVYAKQRFASVCGSLKARGSDWNPALPAAWKGLAEITTSEAVVAYDCATSDGPRVVEVYARTARSPESEELWRAYPVMSLIAAPESLRMAEETIQRMMGSWQVDPDWEQHQNQMAALSLDRIRVGFGRYLKDRDIEYHRWEAETNRAIDRYGPQEHAEAWKISAWGESLMGLTSLRDPLTGEQFRVWNGPKVNDYGDGSGAIVNSSVRPGADFHLIGPPAP